MVTDNNLVNKLRISMEYTLPTAASKGNIQNKIIANRRNFYIIYIFEK